MITFGKQLLKLILEHCSRRLSTMCEALLCIHCEA